MKKVFLLFLCALTICTLFIMPASAAGEGFYSVGLTDGCATIDDLPLGLYRLVGFDTDECDFIDTTVDLTFDGLCTYVELHNGEIEICYIDGLIEICVTATDPAITNGGISLELIKAYEEPIIGASIWDVFTGVGNYISESLNSATALFYNADSATLTPVGTLSIVAVAVALATLIIALLRNYLHLS